MPNGGADGDDGTPSSLRESSLQTSSSSSFGRSKRTTSEDVGSATQLPLWKTISRSFGIEDRLSRLSRSSPFRRARQGWANRPPPPPHGNVQPRPLPSPLARARAPPGAAAAGLFDFEGIEEEEASRSSAARLCAPSSKLPAAFRDLPRKVLAFFRRFGWHGA